MNNPEFELLVYLITSARALPEEPASYGWIRLTEAASRLCQIICNNEPDNEAFRELLNCIEADKGKALTEPERFSAILEKASGILVDCL